VNPTQFGPNEDFEKYPRTGEADLAACRRRSVDAIFMPEVETMCPAGRGETQITAGRLGETLCGQSRPEHFAGVCTVVAKLFNIVQPDKAYFGAKDYQQAVIIRQMVRDLNMPVEIIVCPTVREKDGLAMSTRNKYLSPEQRKEAAELGKSLQLAAEMIRSSSSPADEVIAAIEGRLAAHAPGGKVDYIQIVDPNTFVDVKSTEAPVLIALAVRFGAARLIDNILVDAHSK
ncbi:MAG: pantoate--beta-alanine ligase, partial [Phycisphaerae bacterium]|nr:pantoate--beta-alanine ligase [Phycisphaerae bacterium]